MYMYIHTHIVCFEFCLLKGIAEGTYNSKHAEAAKLYYTTI